MRNPFRIIYKYITDPLFRFNFNTIVGLHNKMSDIKFLKKRYKLVFNKELDLLNPITFNEKLQWLKIYDRKPEYTIMVDKNLAKNFVAKTIGIEHIIPTIGIWTKFDDIEFSRLPQKFVLKCTHDSGGLIICRDKDKLDINAARKKINKSLKRNYFYQEREWPYKNVKPMIIAEQYMEDYSNTHKCENERKPSLIDYKFYCFNGVPKLLYISSGLEDHSTARISFVNLDWTKSKIERSDYRPFELLPPKPKRFDEMIEISKQLSRGLPFLRVDLYEINGVVFFSELTFTPCSGLMPFKNEQDNIELGAMIVLPTNKKE